MKDYARSNRANFLRRADRHETALCIGMGLILAGLVVGYLWHHFS